MLITVLISLICHSAAYQDRSFPLMITCVWFDLGRDFSPARTVVKMRSLVMQCLPSQKHIAESRTRHLETELDYYHLKAVVVTGQNLKYSWQDAASV